MEEMQRMKEDYNSRKWRRGGGMRTAPSFSRTYLSEYLALNFTGDQKKRWLELSTSSIPPSVVPPDRDTDRPLSLEEMREKVVENRASYFRIKSCPPDYIINPRYYRTIIQRNRNFARSIKSIKVSPDKTPAGESFRSFVLGARYTDIHCHPGPVKRYDILIPRKENPDSPVTPRGPIKMGYTPTGPRLNTLHSNTAQFRKSYSTVCDRSEGQRSTPLIAVYGSTPQSPRHHRPTSVHSSGPRSPKPSEDGHELERNRQELRSSRSSPPRTSTPDIKVTTSPQNTEPNSSIEHVNLEQDCFGAAEEAREVTQMVEVALGTTEGDFISPEAQKLAGEILKESQLEDSVQQNTDDGNVVEEGDIVGGEQLETVQDPHQQQADPDPIADKTEENEAMEANVVIDDSDLVEVTLDETNMTSKSSTIFVDMSNLTFQQEDSNT